ncbi:MAG TPA: EAL domain-containing protein [Actinomycetota bacterium]|nr:EAL domain-containing protein [Actinomycetota bacterium]
MIRNDERPDPHLIEGGFFAPTPSGAADDAARLVDLEARYRGLIDRLPAVVYIDGVGEHDRMVDVGEGVEELLGITREEWLAGFQAWARVIHPDDLERVIAESDRAVALGVSFRTQYRAVRPDGSIVWVSEDSVLIHDDHGEPLYWLGLMLDVTELVAARSGLRAAREQYGALVEQIPAIVYVDIADESWTTTYVSPQIRSILGVTPEAYQGESDLWGRMLHPDDRERAIAAYERGRDAGQPFSMEYRLIAADGRVVWFQDSALVLPGPDGAPAFIQGVMLDITERKRAEDRLAYLAYHDHVTDLANKAKFDELLDLAVTRARRAGAGLAVLALDVDNFKLVNDSLGHEAGDRLIVQLAARLEDATRDTDLIARQGGDEFLILLADVDTASPVLDADGVRIAAEAVAERIRDALTAPFVVDDTELFVTVSIGITQFPRDADDAGDLLRNADAAMFRAKSLGPGVWTFHEPEDADARARLSLSTRLRRAVEDRAWRLHYQPLVDLHDGSMFGVEALIRWPDPSGGLVQPGEFIPLAEEMGLIDAIGDWVVEEIGRQDAAWRAEGLDLEIGFNLSPRQLRHGDPVTRIAQAITSADVDPERITVEVTESTAMDDPDRIIELLRRFKDLGVQLAIDDFGTGYSSLARLRYMPVDVLKIDRTFIREVDHDRQSASMVSAIIALANNLGMVTLAEGIETEEEWRFLADRGCPFGQGYFFSRPIPAEEITAMYRRRGLRLVETERAS